MPYQLRISLDRTRVWRGIIVPESLTLGSLHLVIQQAMGWEDRHLFMVKVGQKRYGPDDLDEESITLKQVFKGSTKSIGYVYDFGDWWEHTVTFEQAVPKMAETLVVGGEGECPAEESGGLDRWGLHSQQLRQRHALSIRLRRFWAGKPLPICSEFAVHSA